MISSCVVPNYWKQLETVKSEFAFASSFLIVVLSFCAMCRNLSHVSVMPCERRFCICAAIWSHADQRISRAFENPGCDKLFRSVQGALTTCLPPTAGPPPSVLCTTASAAARSLAQPIPAYYHPPKGPFQTIQTGQTRNHLISAVLLHTKKLNCHSCLHL